MMIDKKQRRLNWPGIAEALRRVNRMHLNKDNKSPMRKYYVDGVNCKFHVSPALEYPVDLLARVILEPESTKEDWKRWVAESTAPVSGHPSLLSIMK